MFLIKKYSLACLILSFPLASVSSLQASETIPDFDNFIQILQTNAFNVLFYLTSSLISSAPLVSSTDSNSFVSLSLPTFFFSNQSYFSSSISSPALSSLHPSHSSFSSPTNSYFSSLLSPLAISLFYEIVSFVIFNLSFCEICIFQSPIHYQCCTLLSCCFQIVIFQ